MGGQAAVREGEDDVAGGDRRAVDRLDVQQVVLADHGMHAVAAGAELHGVALREQVDDELRGIHHERTRSTTARSRVNCSSRTGTRAASCSRKLRVKFSDSASWKSGNA